MGHVLNRSNRTTNSRGVERLGLTGSESVLEVAFGGGSALAAILKRTDGPVAGIEISETMLAQVGRRFRRELELGKLDLKAAGVSDIPHGDGSFDRALTVHTVCFWPDPAAGLREIHRVLRQRGRLVIATVAREEMERSSFTQHGFRLFGNSELEALVRGAGFAELEVDAGDSRLFTTGVRR